MKLLQSASVFLYQSWSSWFVYLGADCAEWDGFRGYDCFDARGSWTEIRSCSSTPPGSHACFQDVVCLMCTDAEKRLGSESQVSGQIYHVILKLHPFWP